MTCPHLRTLWTLGPHAFRDLAELTYYLDLPVAIVVNWRGGEQIDSGDEVRTN
jgi:hypothetical protein